MERDNIAGNGRGTGMYGRTGTVRLNSGNAKINSAKSGNSSNVRNISNTRKISLEDRDIDMSMSDAGNSGRIRNAGGSRNSGNTRNIGSTRNAAGMRETFGERSGNGMEGVRGMSSMGDMDSRRAGTGGDRLRGAGQVTYFDYSLLFITIFMVCFGLVVLYSASSYEAAMEFGNSKYYLRGQLVAVVGGIIIMGILVFLIDYHNFKRSLIAMLAYGGSIIVAMAVLTPIGVSANGARRWINVGMSIQVCEVVKIGLIIFMAYFIDKNAKKLKSIKTFAICMVLIVIPAAVIAFVTIDLSSAVVVGAIGVIMLFIACPKITYFLVLAGLGVGAVAGAILIEPYRLERVKIWQHPEKYPDGYQVMQSLYSLGSGGLFGKGLGKGIQKLGYVPEAQNDMIFTVICEELGVIGGIAVILMFVFMIWRFMVISNNAPDLFGSLLVVGVMAHISVQSVMNIAVVTNSMPNTGVTLPFMSYGGSSIICLLFEIGLVLSVSKRIRFE